MLRTRPARKDRVENAVRTPFPNKRAPFEVGGKSAARVASARPLVDKTPFPNRATQKLPKLLESLYPTLKSETATRTPELQRPSSTRRSTRSRRKFETPLVNGNPWDASEGCIDTGPAAPPEQEGEMEWDDGDSIEYMPPKGEDEGYDGGDVDYKAVGATLWRLGHSCMVDEGQPAEHATSGVGVDWDMLPRLPAEKAEVEDPFSRPAPRGEGSGRRAARAAGGRGRVWAGVIDEHLFVNN